MSGRNTQVARIYAVLDILEQAPQGLTVAEIWERAQDRCHEVGRRTIYRDLEALNAAGFPLFPQSEDKTNTRWVLQKTARITQYLMLSARELLALFLARSALTPLSSTPFYQDLQHAFSKIEEKLGARHKSFLNELAEEVHFQPVPKWGLGLDPETLETVRASISEGHVLSVEYASASSGTRRRRRLGPHYLYFAKGSIYLIAEDLEDSEVKVFSLPRMSGAEMTDEAYGSPVVAPEELFKNSIGVFRGSESVEVRIQFSRATASYVKERGWHPSQRVSSKADGTLVLALEVAQTPELVQWVLGFGPEARVLRPVSLRRAVRQAAEATLKLYRKKSAA